MSLLDDVPASAVVGLDSSPFIYIVEEHPLYKPLVFPLFEERFEQGLNQGVTSVVSLAEVLVQPLQKGRNDLVLQYRDLLTTNPAVLLVDLTPPLGKRAADLRARYKLRLPDAFQLAAALAYGATHFVTNDKPLRKVTELTVLILDDYLPPPP